MALQGHDTKQEAGDEDANLKRSERAVEGRHGGKGPRATTMFMSRLASSGA
jgi:hypothetical protein